MSTGCGLQLDIAALSKGELLVGCCLWPSSGTCLLGKAKQFLFLYFLLRGSGRSFPPLERLPPLVSGGGSFAGFGAGDNLTQNRSSRRIAGRRPATPRHDTPRGRPRSGSPCRPPRPRPQPGTARASLHWNGRFSAARIDLRKTSMSACRVHGPSGLFESESWARKQQI